MSGIAAKTHHVPPHVPQLPAAVDRRSDAANSERNFSEATLSFLGVGLPVSEPSLGLLISNGLTTC